MGVKEDGPVTINGANLAWEIGIIVATSGVVDSSYTTYISTTDYIPVSGKRVTYTGPTADINDVKYFCYMTQYDSDKSLIRRDNIRNATADSPRRVEYNCAYVRFSFGHATSTSVNMNLQDGDLFTALAEPTGMPYAKGTWDDLFYCIDNNLYSTEYVAGDAIPLDLGTDGVLNMQIVAFDADTITGGTDKAPVTLISSDLYKTTRRFNPAYSSGTVGTGAIGGWPNCELRTYINSTISPLIPSKIASRIVTVKKYSKGFDTSDTALNNMQSDDAVWVPSMRELGFATVETNGPSYSSFYNSNTKKIKNWNNTAATYNTRSANLKKTIWAILSTGFSSDGNAEAARRFPLGFCVK